MFWGKTGKKAKISIFSGPAGKNHYGITGENKMDDFEQYEKDCKRIRKENKKLLKGFEKELTEAGLSPKTIKNHCTNIEFFLDNYLMYSEAISAAKGITEIGWYLGDFFIRKCMWSTSAQTKQNASSFKKFYSYMHSIGKISEKELNDMNYEIKTFLPDWIEAVNDYNNFDDE